MFPESKNIHSRICVCFIYFPAYLPSHVTLPSFAGIQLASTEPHAVHQSITSVSQPMFAIPTTSSYDSGYRVATLVEDYPVGVSAGSGTASSVVSTLHPGLPANLQGVDYCALEYECMSAFIFWSFKKCLCTFLHHSSPLICLYAFPGCIFNRVS